MQSFDLVIRNATVATAADSTLCDIGISGGKIAALGTRLGAGGDADTVVDIPTIIRVRLRRPGARATPGVDNPRHVCAPPVRGRGLAAELRRVCPNSTVRGRRTDPRQSTS